VSSATLELCKPLISLCAAHKRVAPLTSKTGQRDNALETENEILEFVVSDGWTVYELD